MAGSGHTASPGWQEGPGHTGAPAPESGKLAFVLSAGGSLGSVQVGCIEALIRHGVFPDLVVGTSVGALNGVWMAKDPTLNGVEKLKELWLSLKPHGPFQEGNLRVLMRLLLGRSYLFANKALRKLVCQYVGGKTFEDLAIPAVVVATNLETGEPAYFRQGLLEPAVMASTAIPGAFPPVEIDGVEYIDGAMMSKLRTGALLGPGCPPYRGHRDTPSASRSRYWYSKTPGSSATRPLLSAFATWR